MINLKQYSNRQDTNYIIAAIVDDGAVLGFTVCDRNLERYTDKNFRTADRAMTWAEKNFKELV